MEQDISSIEKRFAYGFLQKLLKWMDIAQELIAHLGTVVSGREGERCSLRTSPDLQCVWGAVITAQTEVTQRLMNWSDSLKREGREEKQTNPGPSDPKVILPLLKVTEGRFRNEDRKSVV